MPLPLSVNATPVGRLSAVVIAAVGTPVVSTVKLPAVPAVKLALSALVIAGAVSTVSVKAWLASGDCPFAASIVKWYVPAGVAAVLASVAVPSPLSTKVTPVGSVSAVVIAANGPPVVCTVKVCAVPAVKVRVSALLIVGALAPSA